MYMKHTLMLILPLALMAACSNPPANSPAAPGSEPSPAPASAPVATQNASAALSASLLHANHWRLESATDASGKRIDALFARADKPVTLDFKEDRIAISNTCNRMGGGYTLADGSLTISPMASTMMACTDKNLMALDQAVGSRLEGALKTELGDAGQLTLRTANGDVLVFTPEPTAETRYGGEGETVFLEVAAQTKPCPHPMIRDKQCLQTREIRYDANGIKQGEPGEWQNFYDAIEGYTHEDGVRNVVRVKRYKIANPPADASSNAYVLDMVVESANEKK
jgi:heat shock protein HslJ